MNAPVDLYALKRDHGGTVTNGGRTWQGPGPGHSRRDASLKVDIKDDGRILVNSFARDPLAACEAHLGFRVRGTTIGQAADHVTPARPVAQPPPTADERTAYALSIWRQSAHPAQSPVEAYLLSRGLGLPDDAAGEAIRWHSHCPFGKGARTGCMVALVRDIHTDTPKAIHRTALTADGRKAVVNGVSRLSLGPIGGGAVKLSPDADVTMCLGVGEGLETTMSLRLLPGCVALPIWALLAANQLAALPVLPGIGGLWIAVDHDPTGLAVADTLRARWRTAGVDVVTARSKVAGEDLNDVAGLAGVT